MLKGSWLLAVLLALGCGVSPTDPSGGMTSSSNVTASHRSRAVHPSPAAGALSSGHWGGDHAGLVIGLTGASVEYDCAHGTIDVPFALGASGEFDLRGTHDREHGGPVREDEVPDRHPARYQGTVKGESMTMTVTLTDTGQTIGTFNLRRGSNPNVFKCL
jgi:hypothetical protein